MTKRNILIGLSGGPSVAINSSLAGIIDAAYKSDKIDTIYGAVNGIVGVLTDNIIALNQYADEKSLEILKQTPAMAIGSCRKKLVRDDFETIVSVLRKHEIGCFFYIGGNDSMDTVLKLKEYFVEENIDILVIGVPKTIDNDLMATDHTPGFGSSAKYLYHTVNEIICDSEIYPIKNVVIIEIMGRDSGWLTLAAGLSRFLGGKLPHIIAIPEVAFDEDKFIKEINSVQESHKTVVCVVSEGIMDSEKNYIGESAKSGMVDTFGHTYLSGVGKYLESLVMEKIGCKVRSIELNVMQRCSSHLASKCDIDEAFLLGQEAVKAALNGETGIMMCLIRISNTPYDVTISTVDIKKVANEIKVIPEKWFNLYDEKVGKEITKYLLPLIEGNVTPITDETGLPLYANYIEN